MSPDANGIDEDRSASGDAPLLSQVKGQCSSHTVRVRLLQSPRRAHPPMRPAYWRTVPHRGMRHSPVKSSDNATAVLFGGVQQSCAAQSHNWQ